MTLIFLSHNKLTKRTYSISDTMLSAPRKGIDWDKFADDHEYYPIDFNEHVGLASKTLIINSDIIVQWAGIKLIARSAIRELQELRLKSLDDFMADAEGILDSYIDQDVAITVFGRLGDEYSFRTINTMKIEDSERIEIIAGTGMEPFLKHYERIKSRGSSEDEWFIRTLISVQRTDMRYVDFQRELFGTWFELVIYTPSQWSKVSHSIWEIVADSEVTQNFGGPKLCAYTEERMLLADIVEIGKIARFHSIPQKLDDMPLIPTLPLRIAADLHIVSVSNSKDLPVGTDYEYVASFCANIPGDTEMYIELFPDGKVSFCATPKYFEFVENTISAFKERVLKQI